MQTRRPIHHLELWTSDLATAGPEWAWLLHQCGWSEANTDNWPEARMWDAFDGTYLVLEQSPAVSGAHNRMNAGMNHVALTVEDRETLDRIRESAVKNGWRELFADSYPHAGGPDHVALYLENSEGFEAELVAHNPQ